MGVVPEAVNEQAWRGYLFRRSGATWVPFQREATSKLRRTIYKYRIDPVEAGLLDYNWLENR